MTKEESRREKFVSCVGVWELAGLCAGRALAGGRQCKLCCAGLRQLTAPLEGCAPLRDLGRRKGKWPLGDEHTDTPAPLCLHLIYFGISLRHVTLTFLSRVALRVYLHQLPFYRCHINPKLNIFASQSALITLKATLKQPLDTLTPWLF